MSANKYKVLDLSALKWIALITMLIDHIAATMMPHFDIVEQLFNIDTEFIYNLKRGIGTISFPIYSF